MHSYSSRDLHHGTKQSLLFAVGIPFIAITSVLVFFRIYVRTRLMKLQLAADDCNSWVFK